MTDKINYGLELRALREKFGLRQGQVARILHTSAQTVGAWENGRRNMSWANFELLKIKTKWRK